MNIKRANFLIGRKSDRDMAYNLRPLPTFDKSLDKLDNNISRRVIEKLDRLAENPALIPRPMGGLPKDLIGLHKTRVGDWRVFFWVNHEKKEIVLYFVEHRDEIYKRLYKK